MTSEKSREKLIELLREAQYLGGLEEKIADHLIANGVTLSVTDINVGDKVFALYSVEEYQTRFGTTQRRHWQIDTLRSLRMHMRYGVVEVHEKNCTKTDMYNFGRTVFKTREDAEKALKG